jgi:hypothetical protein
LNCRLRKFIVPLLHAGADVNDQSDDGWSLWKIITWNILLMEKNEETFKYLIQQILPFKPLTFHHCDWTLLKFASCDNQNLMNKWKAILFPDS